MRYQGFVSKLGKAYLFLCAAFLILLLIAQIYLFITPENKWSRIATVVSGEYRDDIHQLMATNSADDLFGYITIELINGGNKNVIVQINDEDFTDLSAGIARIKVRENDVLSLSKLDKVKSDVQINNVSDSIDESNLVVSATIFQGELDLGVIKFK